MNEFSMNFTEKFWENKNDNLLLFKGTVRLGFHDRKYQVIENEKFEEWTANRPSERLLEIGKHL